MLRFGHGQAHFRFSAAGRSHAAAIARALVAVAMVALAGIPALAAPSIVVEVNTGKVLSQHQAFDHWYPASLTKLMTVYTVFRQIAEGRITMRSPVKVSANALAEPPAKMGFPVGSVMTVETAIKIMMVKSANDIATATAESVGGSEQAFVAMMNGNASRLGMNDTHFVNANGLYDPAQYTTARDLAVLAIAIRKEFPQYARYFSIQAIRAGRRRLTNHNPLLFRFDGTTGMKTGFLCASGLNIVVSARRGLRELVAVVLGGVTGQERSVRAAMLLTRGFKTNGFFIHNKLATLKPVGVVHRQPVDLRDTVCSRRKHRHTPVVKDINSAVFAMKPPTLADLEKKYLKPRRPLTDVERVVLGHATGPDPFGLLGKATEPDISAYAADTAGKNGKWPVVFGTKHVLVPVPEPNPRRK